MIGIGMQVYFRSFVYDEPFAPYFEKYRGHRFEVRSVSHDKSHIELRCVTGDVHVDGMVHPEYLKRA